MKVPALSELTLFENDDLLIINKPPFVASLDERTGEGISIIRMVKQEYPDAQLCHRLDKETSGALVIAKNPDTYRHVSIQFEKRKVEKVYHALIHGVQRFEEKKVDLSILNLGKSNVKIDREGKRAITFFHSIEFFKHFTLVECRPLTGRMHQIRIHLAANKAVIVGDELYGGQFPYLSHVKRGYKAPGKDEEEQPLIRRFVLHAAKISFTAADESLISVEAPYPKDIATLLRMLRKFDA